MIHTIAGCRTLPIALALLVAPLAVRAEEGVDAEYRALLETWKRREFEQAVRLARELRDAHPDYKYAAAVLYLGGNSALQAGHHARAEGFYRELIGRFPGYKKTDEARNELVTALSRLRKLDACRSLCDENLERFPDSEHRDRWVFVKAECLFRKFEFAEAEKAFESFLEEHPDSTLAEAARRWLDRIDPVWEADESGLVRGYDGKYVGDVRLARALAEIPSAVEAGHRVLRERLGVDLRGRVRILIRIEDAGSREGTRGNAYTVAVEGEPVEVIRCHAEYVVLSPADFRSRIAHEMKHVGFRSILGQAYLDLPKWVREGLAVWGAGQLPARRDAILSGVVFTGRDPFALLQPIDHPVHGYEDYLGSAMAFEWLESRGEGKVRELCRRLLAGEDHRQAFGDLAGMPCEKALGEALGFARDRVREWMGAAWVEYRALRDALLAATRKGPEARAAWLAEGGAEDLAGWLEAHRGHLLEPNVRYRLGKTQVQVGEHERGRAWLWRVVSEDFDRSTICDDALYWIARSFELQGDEEKAREAYGVLLRDYSWSTAVRKNVKGERAPAGPVVK